MSNGKGDKPRPLSVPIATYKENYNRIFRKKQQEEITEVEEILEQKVKENESISREEIGENGIG